MATNDQGIREEYQAWAKVADTFKTTIQALASSSSQSVTNAIDWRAMTNVTHPNIVDGEGYIIGEKFTPDDVADWIGSANELKKFWDNQAAAPGAHGSNSEKLSRAV